MQAMQGFSPSRAALMSTVAPVPLLTVLDQRREERISAAKAQFGPGWTVEELRDGSWHMVSDRRLFA